MSDYAIREMKPVARKNHQCSLCLRVIEKGTQYEARVGVCDGRISTWKAHLACVEVTREWDRDDWEFAPAGRDFIEQYLGEKPEVKE